MNTNTYQDLEKRLISCYTRNNTLGLVDADSDSEYEINMMNPLEELFKMIDQANNKNQDLCVSVNDDEDYIICDNITFTQNSNCMCDIEVKYNSKNNNKYSFFTLDKNTDEEVFLFQINRKTKQFKMSNISFQIFDCAYKQNSLFFSFNYMNYE